MVQIKTKTANRANYGSMRALSKIEWIAIHYTANDGDSDEGNANYFAGRIVKASAHYFVDDDSITQSVPDDYVAYAVGGNRYNTGGGRLYGVVNNTNSISIELCDSFKNGVVYPTEQTIQNALELVRTLMARYGIPQEHVIRHYDVNGKPCPAYWTDDARWKEGFWDRIPADPDTAKYGAKLEKKKYEMLKTVHVRSRPGMGDETKVKYKALDDVTKAKCSKDADGYAKWAAGKRYDRVRKYTGGKGNTWHQTAKGYWLPRIVGGEKYSKAV